MEGGERQIEFGLDPGDPGDPASGGLALDVIQQGGLAHAGLAPQDEHGALAAPDPPQRLIQPVTLMLASLEDRRRFHAPILTINRLGDARACLTKRSREPCRDRGGDG
ncbi:hypothetical protein Ssi02_43440 [Sinosporangium siamense]|uniref:Uncharacterized protein n=1 Tax=Sinosporangium siamense TaxID=1367973 RepID=A0A919V857_9ACTN|nr:hypothetical protein Ssi02_43440 [Sinosporangium siamense]